jgi:hypothetical protein
MEEQVVGEELGELGAYSRVVGPYHVTLRVFMFATVLYL